MDLLFMGVLMGTQCVQKYSFSRKVLWLEVSTTNKDSRVIAGYYLKAVQEYGENNTIYSFDTDSTAFVNKVVPKCYVVIDVQKMLNYHIYNLS